MSDWTKDKDQGPWEFEKQRNKYGYDNNPRWQDEPVAPFTPTSEKVIWTPAGRTYSSGEAKSHHKCGHWHVPVVTVPTTAPSAQKIIIAGQYYNGNTYNYHPAMLAVDGDSIPFAKIFYLTSTDFGLAHEVIQVSDGLVLGGEVYDDTVGVNRLLLLKTDTLGVLQWSKIYDGVSADERITAIVEDGTDLVMCGEVVYLGNPQGLVMKTSSDGTIQWQKRFSGISGKNYFSGICKVSTGGYLITGYTTAFDPGGNSSAVIIKVNSDGSLAWSYYYGTSGYENGLDIIELSSGNFFITGVDEDNKKFQFMEINSSGTLLWSKEILADSSFGDRGGYVAREVSDGFIVSGYFTQDVTLMKLNASGVVQWSGAYSDGSGNYSLLGDTSGLQVNDNIDFVSMVYASGIHTYDLLLNRVNLAGGGITNVSYKTFSSSDAGFTSGSCSPNWTTLSLAEISHTPHWDDISLVLTTIEDASPYYTKRISTNQYRIDIEPYQLILED